MTLSYVAAFTLFDPGEVFGVALAVAVIGPIVVFICITIATSLRHRELTEKLRACQPVAPRHIE